jgi:hypothetical protein
MEHHSKQLQAAQLCLNQRPSTTSTCLLSILNRCVLHVSAGELRGPHCQLPVFCDA